MAQVCLLPSRHIPCFILIECAGDYEVTTRVHNDTYPEIDPRLLNLQGKSVFITGGSRGLGRSMALSFAKAGVSKIAVGARSSLESLAKEIAEACVNPPEFLPVKLDVTDEASVAAAATEVGRAFGQLNVLVNNAGILGKYGLIADSDPEEWWEVLNVNLRGPYLVTRAFVPLLLKASKDDIRYIVNVCSVGAHLTNPTLSSYQVSKNALLKLTTLTNAEYGPGVITFAIHPGNSPTDIMGGPEAIPPHHKHGKWLLRTEISEGIFANAPFASVCGNTGAQWGLGGILGVQEARVARRQIYQLHLGFTGVDVQGG